MEKRECGTCGGTGQKYDITCADKVNAGPYVGRCPTCRGKGYTEHVNLHEWFGVTTLPTYDTAPAEPVVIGETPDWMLGL